MNPADRLTVSDLYFIQNHLIEVLSEQDSIKRGEVFDAVGVFLKNKLKKTEFSESLSHNIKAGKLAGFKIVRGPYGGVVLDDKKAAQECFARLERERDLEQKGSKAPKEEVQAKKVVPKKEEKAPKKEEKAEPKPELKPYIAPAPQTRKPFTTIKSTYSLWIKDSKYAVPMTRAAIECLIVRVVCATVSSDGDIVFDGKRYSGDEALLHRYLTAFVGLSPTVSEPILDTTDINGVPINLIDGIDSPQALEEWNKKQQGAHHEG